MLLFNRYEYHPQTDLIGKGGFSRVYKALDKKLNRNVALKIYKTNELAEKYSPIAEIQRVIDFDHPNISRYIDIEEILKEDAFGDVEKIQVCVMEYLDGGNLANFYKTNKNLEQFKQLLQDVLRGLAYLHQNDVIHRDIKPANILIKNTPRGPVAKITDFGISKRSDASFNSTSSALIVSIPYMAPEQLNPQRYGINENISYNIDLWMLGVTVYEIITGDVLFKNDAHDTSEQIMTNIMLPEIPEKINQLPHPFREFVQTCLIKDANTRVQKADELFVVLQQPIVEEDSAQETPTEMLPEQPIVTDPPEEAPSMPIERVQEEDLEATRMIAPSEITQLIAAQEPVSDDTMIIAAPVAIIHQEPATAADDETRVLVGKREKAVNLFNRYDYYPISDCIGKGGFSRVYKAYDKKLSRWVALKIYKTGEFSDRYSPIAEIKRVVNLDHPNICRYLDMEEIENKNPFGENEIIQVCVMELLDSGNILEYYRKNQEPQVLIKLVRDILNGLAYLHRNAIIHRDIKPANILIKSSLEGPVAKITDFGISKATDNLNSNSSSALVVSIPYMAPEQLNIKKYGIDEKIASNLDLWSLGVTIYEIITGKVLFKNNDKDSSEQVMANIMSPRLPEKINELPEPFRKIVSLCVVKNARDRVQRAEILLQVLDAATLANPQPIKEEFKIPDPKVKSSIFLQEDEKAETKKGAIVQKKETEAAGKPTFTTWQQRLVPFIRRHRIKLAGAGAGVLALLAAVFALPLFIQNNAATTPDTNKFDTAVIEHKVLPTTLPAADTARVAPIHAPVPKKQEPKVNKEPAISKKKTTDNKEEERQPSIGANEKSIVVITTSKNCSLRIASAENGTNEYIPSLKNGFIQLPLYPGTYQITAVSLSDKNEVFTSNLVVHPKKSVSFTIRW